MSPLESWAVVVGLTVMAYPLGRALIWLDNKVQRIAEWLYLRLIGEDR